MSGYIELFNHKELYIIKIENFKIVSYVVDKYLKKLGYLLSSAQRDRVKRESSIVFGGVWSLEIVSNTIYISPYIKINIPKRYRALPL